VEAIREIEDQGYGDDRDDDEQLCHSNPHPDRAKPSLFWTVLRRMLRVLLATRDRGDKRAVLIVEYWRAKACWRFTRFG
jgi:hypothetical protein